VELLRELAVLAEHLLRMPLAANLPQPCDVGLRSVEARRRRCCAGVDKHRRASAVNPGRAFLRAVLAFLNREACDSATRRPRRYGATQLSQLCRGCAGEQLESRGSGA